MKPKIGDTRTVQCTKCRGTGKARAERYSIGNGFSYGDVQTCIACEGSGKVVHQFQGDGAGGSWYYLKPA